MRNVFSLYFIVELLSTWEVWRVLNSSARVAGSRLMLRPTLVYIGSIYALYRSYIRSLVFPTCTSSIIRKARQL